MSCSNWEKPWVGLHWWFLSNSIHEIEFRIQEKICSLLPQTHQNYSPARSCSSTCYDAGLFKQHLTSYEVTKNLTNSWITSKDCTRKIKNNQFLLKRFVHYVPLVNNVGVKKTVKKSLKKIIIFRNNINISENKKKTRTIITVYMQCLRLNSYVIISFF